MVYVGNAILCSHGAKAVMSGMAEKFEVNNDKISEPKLYLGVNIKKFKLPNVKHAWCITSNSFVQGDIDTVQRLLG